MRLIVKRVVTHFDLGHFELAFYLTGDERNGYGIKIIESCDEKVRTSCNVDNISRSHSEISELIDLCAEAALCPVHLPDVIMDYYTQKRLRCLAESEPSSA